MAKDKERSTSQNSRTIAQTEPQLTAQEILSQGEQASRLLDSPIYNIAHRSVIQNLQDEWMTTDPKEREKREGLYQMVRGLSTVSSEMAMMIERARLISDDEMMKENKLQLAYDENTGFNLGDAGEA